MYDAQHAGYTGTFGMIQLHKLVRYPAPGRIFYFLLLLALVWVPIALPLYAWLGTNGSLSVIPLT